MTPGELPTVPATAAGDGVPLLDVREPHEWEAGHAPDALHVPMHDVPGRLAELPTDGPLDVVCHYGGRSAQVVAWLRSQGVDARNVDGGMDAWQAAGRPVVRDDGSPGEVV